MSVLEQQLAREVESVPEFLKQEVLDFVMFLKEKHLKKGIQKHRGFAVGRPAWARRGWQSGCWWRLGVRAARMRKFCRITRV